MNIGVTGCSSPIGTKLCELIKNAGHNLIMIGRNEEAVWRFGEKLPSLNFELLIHIAHDRSLSSDDSLSGNELLLNSLPQNAFVVYLSTTSAHANTLSQYGRSKYQCENLFLSANAAIVKSGLIFDSALEKQNGVLGKLESYSRKLPVIPIPFAGKPTFYMSCIDALGNALLQLSVDRRPGRYAAFSYQPLSLFELIYRFTQSSKRKARLVPLPDFPTRDLLIRLSKFKHSLGSLDSLISLIEEIPEEEIRSLMPTGLDFPNY